MMWLLVDFACLLVGTINMVAAVDNNNTAQAIVGLSICVFSILNLRRGK